MSAIIKKIKLTEVERYKARDALFVLSTLCNSIKLRRLSPEAVKDMQTLETAVQHLEVFLLDK